MEFWFYSLVWLKKMHHVSVQRMEGIASCAGNKEDQSCICIALHCGKNLFASVLCFILHAYFTFVKV